MPGVFISYRRDDSGGHVGRLHDRLRAEPEFQRGGFFLDIVSIEGGADYRERIRAAIGLSAVVLAVIGKQWLAIAGAGGARRLDDPNDLVREELACALREGVPVIPVLVGNARSPRAAELPELLQPLARLNTVALSDARFDVDFQALLADVKRLCDEADKAGPKDPAVAAETYLAIGLDRLREKDLETALSCFRAALLQKPDLAMAHVRMATALQFDAFERIRERNYGLALDQLRAAQQSLDQAFVYLKADPAVLVQMGYVYKDLVQAYQAIQDPQLASQSLEQARRHFEMATAYDANDAGAWNGLGSIAIATGNYDAAIGHIDKALAIAPRYPAALHDLAMAHYGRFTQAADAAGRLDAMKGFHDACERLFALEADPASEKLPESALTNLQQIAAWLADAGNRAAAAEEAPAETEPRTPRRRKAASAAKPAAGRRRKTPPRPTG